MQYAADRFTIPSRRSIIAPLVALVIGAAAAVGGYALIDDQSTVSATDKVVFVEMPGPGEGVRGLDDTAKAATTDSTPEVHGGPPTSGNDGTDPVYPHGPGAPFLHR
jgi:hypothetical protein